MNENSLLEISVSGYAERYNGLTRSCGLLQRPSLQASFKRPWFPDPVVEFHGSSRMIYLSFSAFVNWCHIYLCLSFHGFHCEKLSLMFLLSSTPVLPEPFVAPASPHPEHPYHASYRLLLIDWTYELVRDVYANNYVHHLAIQLLDAVAPYLISVGNGSSQSGRPFVQALAICCLNVMLKIHADFCDLFQQIHKAVDGTFTLAQYEWLELATMKVASPSYNKPSSMGFLRLFCTVHPVPRRTQWLMTYLADLVLIYGCEIRRARYSLLAAVVYTLAVGTVNQRDSLNDDPWPQNLAKLTRIDYVGSTGGLLLEVLYDVYYLQEKLSTYDNESVTSSFFRKYRSANCLGVGGYETLLRKNMRVLVDELTANATGRAHMVKSERNEVENVLMRCEPRGPHPFPENKAGSHLKGRYFSRVDCPASASKRVCSEAHDFWND